MISFRRAKVYQSVLVLSAIIATSNAIAAPAPPELYHLMREAQLKVRDADNKMIDNIAECSKLLERNYRLTKKLPQSMADFESILNQSKLYKTKNPYFESELLSRELPPSTSHLIQFEVQTDYALSKTEIESHAKHPPKSWSGSPGTITIIQNGEHAFALHAYGIDGKPIHDSTTGSAFYLFRDCNQWED